MSDDFIKKALGMSVEPTIEDRNAVTPYIIEPEVSVVDDSVAEADVGFVRDNLIELIAKGSEALDELISIAKQSQHPRAFEVIANLLKTNSELNNDLINVHKKKQDITKKDTSRESARGPNSVTNNLFVGSTAELQRMLADLNNNNKNNDEPNTN